MSFLICVSSSFTKYGHHFLGGFGPADQAEFVRHALTHGVSVMAVKLYLAALIDGACDDQVAAHWREVRDRAFSGLVIGPVAGAMSCAAVLAYARKYLSSNRAVFLLGKDLRSVPIEAVKIVSAA